MMLPDGTKLGTIGKFSGDYRFLSNFWPAKVTYGDDEYDCIEKAYVAAKFESRTEVMINGKWILIRDLARNCETPGKVKRLGRKYKDLMRAGWADMRLPIMELLVHQKFSDKNPDLVKLLLATGECKLIEGNTWGDTFWGIVTGGRNKSLIGQGENHLGKLLMARRDDLLFDHIKGLV